MLCGVDEIEQRLFVPVRKSMHSNLACDIPNADFVRVPTVFLNLCSVKCLSPPERERVLVAMGLHRTSCQSRACVTHVVLLCMSVQTCSR